MTNLEWQARVEGRLTALEDARSWLEKNAAVPEFRAAYDAEEAADYVCWCHELKGDGVQTPRSLFIQQLKARAEAAETTITRLTAPVTDDEWRDANEPYEWRKESAEVINELLARRLKAQQGEPDDTMAFVMAARDAGVQEFRRTPEPPQGEPVKPEPWSATGLDGKRWHRMRDLGKPRPNCICGDEAIISWSGHFVGRCAPCARREGIQLPPDVEPVAAPVVEALKTGEVVTHEMYTKMHDALEAECVSLRERLADAEAAAKQAVEGGIQLATSLADEHAKLAVAERERDEARKLWRSAAEQNSAHRCPTATADEVVEACAK